MDRELEQLRGIDCVGGAFVCDNRGEVIASSSPAVLATVTMNTIGRELGRAFLALEAASHATSRMELLFDSWRLLAHDLHDAVLFVVCEPEADMAVVRMTADVVSATWDADAKVRKRLAGHRTERKHLITATALDQGALQSWTLNESH